MEVELTSVFVYSLSYFMYMCIVKFVLHALHSFKQPFLPRISGPITCITSNRGRGRGGQIEGEGEGGDLI